MSIKYMGSKRVMLMNGLGLTLVEQAAHAQRVVDLFAGSGAVAWYAAQTTDRPVHAYDLQHYSAVLSRAVIGRIRRIEPGGLVDRWLRPTRKEIRRSRLWRESDTSRVTATRVRAARRRCQEDPGSGIVWRAYGGHYFAPRQALALDYALRHLPEREPHRSVCHAAVIAAAGYCAAAPGHTAQPFQPTSTALRYIADNWARDPIAKMESWLTDVAPRHATELGEAGVADAIVKAAELRSTDLVIVDPPYSAVQYSRFYHVLETVAQRTDLEVVGTGRYPPCNARPSSSFSLRTESERAMTKLLDTLAAVGCRVLVTFPAGESSNGLSGSRIAALAKDRFHTSMKTVLGRFSTMGGNNSVRVSRKASAEVILCLAPR